MRISTLALANLRRRKGRAAFLIIGIGIGIATVTVLFSLSRMIKEEIGAQLDQFGANIVIVPKSNSLQLDYAGIAVSDVAFDINQLKNDDVGRISEIPYRNRISIIAPKILGATEVDKQQVVIAGVNFDNEFKLKRWWRMVGQKPASASDVILGYDVAKALSVVDPSAEDLSVPVNGTSAISQLEVSSNHNHVEPRFFRIRRDNIAIRGREYNISGVLTQTGGREDSMIFATINEVQSVLNRPGQLSVIEVSALCKGCPVEDIVAQISSKLPNAKVSSLLQSVSARAETVERLTRFALVVSIVVLLIGALMIFTTMMGAVVERTREIGVLRAIGFRRAHVVRGMLIEVAITSSLGGLAGWIIGSLGAWALMPWFSQTGIKFEFDPALGGGAVLVALLIGMLSSLYPTLRASHLDPTEAVRYV